LEAAGARVGIEVEGSLHGGTSCGICLEPTAVIIDRMRAGGWCFFPPTFVSEGA
jgi:hypothetical protein